MYNNQFPPPPGQPGQSGQGAIRMTCITYADST